MKKATIYIDLDDDIAAISDKIASNDSKLLALVLPKRPVLLQSSVNVRLLKRVADENKKNIVLVTNDDQVVRLSGVSGIHVAESLTSKPHIPTVENESETHIEEINDNGGTDPSQPDVYVDDKKIDLATPVGELAGKPLDDDEINFDNSEVSEPETKPTAKKKRIIVPNFGKFRTKLLLAGFLIVGIGVLIYWGLVIAPQASIVLTTAKSNVNAKSTMTAALSQASVDLDASLLPAVKKDDIQKLTTSFKATGQKDVGEKAKGTVTLRNCESTDPLTIPSGTGVSKGAYTFITQQTITLEGGNFSGGGSVCTTPSSEDEEVDVIASQSGDQYNLSSGTYTVAGFSSVRASGSAMGGGTTKIATVVSQQDIDTAKQAALDKSATDSKAKIIKLLQDEGIVPISETYSTAQGEPTTSVKVGEESAGDVSLNIDVTSTMYGVKQSDIDQFLNKEILVQINQATQKIYETGSKDAVISIVERPNSDSIKMTVATSAQVGPSIDQARIAEEVSGMRSGEVKQMLESRPGVTQAEISLRPFWVFSLPKNTSKITISVNE